MKAAQKEATKLLLSWAEDFARKESAYVSSVSGMPDAFLGAKDVHTLKLLHCKKPMFRMMEILTTAKVGRVSLILIGETVVPRVSIKLGKKASKCSPDKFIEEMWMNLFAISGYGQYFVSAAASKSALEAVLPAFTTVLASIRADVTNAVTKALLDKRVTDPVKLKLEKKHALTKARVIREIRGIVRMNQKYLSKDILGDIWDELVCSEIMES